MKCSREFRAVHDSGSRFASVIRHIFLHDEEASTARSAAQWFANPDSAGSAHLCVDDKECYRTLPDSVIPWAVPGGNTDGLHIEMAGFAAWKKWQWLKHRRMLNNAADRVARWCIRYDIPPRFLGTAELAQDRKGITTHAIGTKVFGGSHTDPGLFFPRRRFMRKVRARVKELESK